MSSLINTKIEDTYEGLIKTADNLPIDANLKNLEDGNGGVLPIQVSTTGVNFTGNVTGLPPVEGGLVAGTGTSSMKSAASLTTTAALANGIGCIALGDATTANEPFSVAIGNGAKTQNAQTVSVGAFSNAGGAETIAIGSFGTATGLRAISIGSQSDAIATGAVALGYFAQATADGAIALGGFGTTATANGAIAIGKETNATAAGAIALGAGVTAATIDTVSVKELETQTAGGGLTLKSADLTTAKITLTDADVLAIGGTNIPANDPVTATVINRFWSGTQAQYDDLGTYNADTIYFIV